MNDIFQNTDDNFVLPKLNEVFGISIASAMTPALMILSFVMLSEFAALYDLGERLTPYRPFSFQVFWEFFQIIPIAYLFLFWMIPIAVLCHLALRIKIFSHQFSAALFLGSFVALILGLSFIGETAQSEFGYARSTMLGIFIVGGGLTGAVNLFVYRLIARNYGAKKV
ncbi:hypothetical protein [Hyphococcus sp.]|uniref:hypothetical protein n=1 Tax=Hyphococcus sp. TaxID=2038636 RepID=UPI003CCB900B